MTSTYRAHVDVRPPDTCPDDGADLFLTYSDSFGKEFICRKCGLRASADKTTMMDPLGEIIFAYSRTYTRRAVAGSPR